MKTYEGGCHCGKVKYTIKTDLAKTAICNCSICTMKGIIHHFIDQQDFQLLQGQENLTDYQFNTKTAHHYFCKTCGIHSFYIARSHPEGIDINVRCLKGVNLDDLKPTHFDGQNWEQSIAKLRGN